MQEYVKKGITDLTAMRKHYNGIPYRDLNTSDYDYFNASPEMIPTEEGQHWDSRNPHTGQILKSENHPTFDLAVKGENEAGYVIRRGIDSNLYSLPKNINYVEENIFASGGDSNTEKTSDNEYYYDYIEPSITKAFDSTEDYNRYYGDLFGRNITKKAGRLARKTGKIAYDIGQFIPKLGTVLDLGEMVYGDELSKQTAAFSNAGSPISALTKLDKYKSVSNFGAVWGTLLQAPDFMLDLYTLYEDIKKPLSQYANGGRILDGKTEDNQTLSNHPVEVRQGVQNGTIKPIQKEDGSYAYIRTEQPLEDLTQPIAEWTVAGDLFDIGRVVEATTKGDLKQAGMLAGLVLVPNALEKVVKGAKRLISNSSKKVSNNVSDIPLLESPKSPIYISHGTTIEDLQKNLNAFGAVQPNPSLQIISSDNIQLPWTGDIEFIGKPHLLDNSFLYNGDGMTSTVTSILKDGKSSVEEISRRMYHQDLNGLGINNEISREAMISLRNKDKDMLMEAKTQIPIEIPTSYGHIVMPKHLDTPEVRAIIDPLGIPVTVYTNNRKDVIKDILKENPNLTFIKKNGGKLLK